MVVLCPVCDRREPYRPQVCDACRSWLRHALRELPDLYDLLDVLPGSSGGPRVSGTPEAAAPLRLAVVDLRLDARAGLVADPYRDQLGELSVATVLDQWVRDWREHRSAGEGLPQPTVGVLASWLGARVDDAADDHPAIEEFAQELRHLLAVLRAANGLIEYDEYKPGVACRRCDTKTLYRPNGSDYIECGACPELLTPEEYDRWCKLLAANLKGAA